MTRPLTIIALILAIFGAVFLAAAIGGPWGLYFVVASLILHICGTLTGK